MISVSVIVPIYNVEQFVARTITSVLAQTWRDFELILVDDGSPDRSLDICRQFDDRRIKIVQQSNRGLATDWRIAAEEPRRTMLTVIAAYLLILLPRGLYNAISRWALTLSGISQQWRIASERTAELA